MFLFVCLFFLQFQHYSEAFFLLSASSLLIHLYWSHLWLCGSLISELLMDPSSSSMTFVSHSCEQKDLAYPGLSFEVTSLTESPQDSALRFAQIRVIFLIIFYWVYPKQRIVHDSGGDNYMPLRLKFCFICFWQTLSAVGCFSLKFFT